jgi:hypothetical protein
MKTKFFFILTFILIINDYSAQIQHAIGMPEYNSLYAGYNNKIVLASNKGKVINPNCLSAEIQEVDSGEVKCYLIRPNYYSKNITVKFDIVDKKEKVIERDSVEFFVKPFPKPVVLNSTVSKASGARILIGLGPDCPISSPDFEVSVIEIFGIENGLVYGNIIPTSIISDIEVDRSIGIAVFCKNSYNGQTLIVPGVLKVTN